MEMNDIQRMLNLNKQTPSGNGGKTTQQQPQALTSGGHDISNLDDAVFGSYVPVENEEASQAWDSKTAYNRMKDKNLQPRENIKNSKIPSAILESVLNNPLDGLAVEDDVDRLVNNLGMVPENIQTALDINRKIESSSQRQMLNEQTNPAPSTSAANGKEIEEIIRRILDEKIGELKKTLINESRTNPSDATMKGFKINNDGKFFFLASNDDLYECKMKYIGKNGKKK